MILRLDSATIPSLILPGLHLVLCVVIQINATDGSWWWFPVFLVDLPFSMLLAQIGFLPPILVFGVFGTLWWYFIGAVILHFYRKYDTKPR